jgi:transposase-like protein
MSKHTSAWWAKRVEELERGGDAEAIAREHGVRQRTLLWWRSELARRARGGADTAPRLLPVVAKRAELRAHKDAPCAASIEVVVEIGAARITARGTLSPEHLATIITAARTC